MYVTFLLVLLPEALVVIMIAVESGDARNGIVEAAAAGDLCALSLSSSSLLLGARSSGVLGDLAT